MKKIPRLIDLFPAWLDGGGIFKAMSSSGYVAPWSSLIAPEVLDLEYLGNHSGYKRPSPLVERLTVDGSLNQEAITRLTRVLQGLYAERWEKLYATMTAEYNPIENYRMEEEGTQTGTVGTDRKTSRTDSEKTTESGTDTGTVKTDRSQTRMDTEKTTETGTQTGTVGNQKTHSLNVDDVLTHSGTEKIERTATDTETPAEVITKTGTGKATQDKSVYAFNSPDKVPSEYQEGDTTTADTETHSGTNKTDKSESETRTPNLTEDRSRTESGSENETRTDDLSHAQNIDKELSGSDTGEETRTDDLTHTLDISKDGSVESTDSETRIDDLSHTLTRHGNIGVTTSQQMLESERELWMWQIFDVVFADVDRVLTIPIY